MRGTRDYRKQTEKNCLFLLLHHALASCRLFTLCFTVSNVLATVLAREINQNKQQTQAQQAD